MCFSGMPVLWIDAGGLGTAREPSDDTLCTRLLLTCTSHSHSNFFGDLLVELMPCNHAHMATDDAWRQHRRLVGDTMSPTFLKNVAGPQIYSNTLDIIKLWREKVRLANDRPFDARQDILQVAFDIVWAVVFGSRTGTIQSQAQLVSSLSQIDLPSHIDAAVDFPRAKTPAAFSSESRRP